MDVGTFKLYMGNNSSEDVLGVEEYHLCTYETLYSPDMRWKLLSVNRLIGDGFDVCCNKNKVSLRVNNVVFAWGSLFS